MTAYTLNLRPTLELTDEQFEQVCQANRDLKFERNARGELIVMALTGGETGRRNMKLSARLENWSAQIDIGVAFDSSTGFRLPNSAIRSPDAAWVRKERWLALTALQRKKYVPAMSQIFWWNCALLVMSWRIFNKKCGNIWKMDYSWVG